MKIEWKTCFKIGASIFILFLCIYYWSDVGKLLGGIFRALAPLFIGFAIAYLVNILMSSYEKLYFPKSDNRFVLKSRRPVCLVSAYITLIAIITLVFVLVLPQFTDCIRLLIDMVPGVMEKAVALIDKYHLLSEDNIAFLESIDWRSRLNEIINVVSSGLGGVMDVVINTVSSVFSAVTTAFISIIFSVYLLSGRDKLLSQCRRVFGHYIKKNVYDKMNYVLGVLNDCFRKYIVGQCTEALILGLLCTAGMLILRLPYATMIGALIALTALIPIAGAYIGAFIGAFMILTVSPVKALVFLIFLVILQQFEGNIIYPKVVGSSLGLPAIWVLAAITIGGGVMGIFGMLIGVPIVAAIYKIIKEDVDKHEPVVIDAVNEAPLIQETEETIKVKSKREVNKNEKINKSKKSK